MLEIGCGRGVGLEILASLGPAELSGFDLDPAMVALARARAAASGPAAHVYVGDATAICAPERRFNTDSARRTLPATSKIRNSITLSAR